jgi:hypothetical protein
MHSTGNYVHPVDAALGGTIIANYNSYVKSGDMSGVVGTSFSSLTPFTSNTGDYPTLTTNALSTNGPSDGDQVNCMSCHRAHATGTPEMVRWNMEGEFMFKASVNQLETRGRTPAEAAAAYYERPATAFANYQRLLCNKCHAKD